MEHQKALVMNARLGSMSMTPMHYWPSLKFYMQKAMQLPNWQNQLSQAMEQPCTSPYPPVSNAQSSSFNLEYQELFTMSFMETRRELTYCI